MQTCIENYPYYKDVITCGLVAMAIFRSLPLITMKNCMESFEEFMKTRALEDLRENLQDPETLSMLEEIIKNKLNNENNEEKSYFPRKTKTKSYPKVA